MAAPYPPQGNQSPHTERPLRVYAEQYVEGQPLPIGAVIYTGLFEDGLPRVPTLTALYVLNPTDWVISNRYTGAAIEVISAEEFAERFGPGGGAPLPEEEPA
jgi:hypothetical protein